VAFHIEIRRGRRWAREFNLGEGRLRSEILDPWTAGTPIHLGDRDWEPAECTLRILEGPELTGPDLAFSRGWERAERTGTTVTKELVEAAAREAATIAVLAETESARDAVMAALGSLGLEAIDWAQSGSEAAALVLAVDTSDPPRGWLYEAGAAVGAVGGQVLVARLSDAPVPSEISGLPSTAAGLELAPALADALGRLEIGPA
jgi:hypothetical protein